MRGNVRRRRRARARRALAVGVMGLVAVPVGLAQMGANSVPQSYAGEVLVPIAFTTTLIADGPDGLGQLSAELEAGGRALADLPVDFAVAATGDTVCDDVPTDSEGVAVCDPAAASGPVAGESMTYLVTFSGLGGLAAASDTVVVLGEPAPDEGSVDPSQSPDQPTPPADLPVDGPSQSPAPQPAPPEDTDAPPEVDETGPDAPPSSDGAEELVELGDTPEEES